MHYSRRRFWEAAGAVLAASCVLWDSVLCPSIEPPDLTVYKEDESQTQNDIGDVAELGSIHKTFFLSHSYWRKIT